MNIHLLNLLWWFNLTYAILFFVVAGIMCLFIRDVSFIKNNKKEFAIETFAWTLSGLPMLVYLYTRRKQDYKINKLKFFLQVGFLSIQIGIINAILEVGGTWTYYFKNHTG